MAVVGVLLLLMALSSAFIRRLPVSTAAIYLIIGFILSPAGFNLLRIDIIESKKWFEYLTEIAVITSLFIGGLKLRLPLKNPAWRAAYLLAGPVMIFSILGVAAVAHFAFGISPAVALLLGACLAPTDPVLASEVSVNNAADNDRMRYGLSGEAGFNDGAAFPFVIFALLWMENGELGAWIGEWSFLYRFFWAIPAGLLLGYFLGKGVGRLAIWLRHRHQETEAPNDFLALALIALSYVAAETIWAWGFLAVFAAGIGLRRAEIKIVQENPLPEHEATTEEKEFAPDDSISHPPAEDIIHDKSSDEEVQKPATAAGIVVSEILSFGNTAERLLEVFLVILVGVSLAVHWNWRAVPLALVFFIVIRPLLTQIFLFKSPTGMMQRWLMGWFGIRGIGSIYYLSYALNHGWETETAEGVGLVISVIAVSIVLHGTTSQPILDRYEKAISEVEGEIK